ncbi:MAG: PEP-CTERM sorting domain-containing protein [Planctomycetota bacterium]
MIWLLLSVSWLFANVLSASEWHFYALGNLGGSTGYGKTSQALGVSSDGRHVVGDSLATAGLGITTGTEALLWTKPDSRTNLGTLSSENVFSSAKAVSSGGDVVVGVSQTADGKRAFRWSPSDGMVSLGVLPGHDESVARGVSADGTVIVGTSSSLVEEMAFRWVAGKMEAIGDLPGGKNESAALAISRDGKTIVGRSHSENGTEAFAWTADQMRGIGDLPGQRFASRAFAVSADGTVIVGDSFSEQGIEAFRWTQDTGMVGLGDLPGGVFRSKANGTSADGDTIVGMATSKNGSEAFIWRPKTKMQSLNQLLQQRGLARQWQLQKACGISDDGGVIIGVGQNPNGETAGWILERKSLR